MFVNNVYGSKHSQSKRSSYIMAAWCGMNGKVDSITTVLRPEQVLFYFKHCLTIGQRVVLHMFAFVQWHHPLQHQGVPSRMEIWCATLFEPFGPTSFLPVQRINSQYVAAINDEQGVYVCPTSQKLLTALFSNYFTMYEIRCTVNSLFFYFNINQKV